ncbi:S-layer homology domain-containing protein [Brevibacillus brevis]|uniref:S-layer homology domain-containing protein n=1 Tax=Brevibacillus brevis TaxID=1393 RepID=UPI00115B93BE|nr:MULTISPECIES: S-layer homology domain-containing protein [Bacillales]TQR36905.1 S-layer homology domain-containing protein [Lysinibacillus sp. SDF0063]UIO40040.1 S-layer homology domain-containing protein [Brevibacillus brevis]
MKRLLSSFLVTSLMLGVTISFPSALHAMGTTLIQKGSVRSDFDTHQYKSDIEYVIEKRVMWKYPNRTFRPTTQMTQSQLLTTLVTVMQLKEKAPLAQLPLGHWAKDIYEKANNRKPVPASRSSPHFKVFAYRIQQYYSRHENN